MSMRDGETSFQAAYQGVRPMDEREQMMLDLMQDCQQQLTEMTQAIRQTQNTINEIWAEWTRTHGLRGIPGKEKAPAKVVRRVVR